MAQEYYKESWIAALAVQKAAMLTKSMLTSADRDTLEKEDQTPVTTADLGAQALIISALHGAFPNDSFVAEESAKPLRDNPLLSKRVWSIVNSTRLEDEDAEELLASPKSEEEMLDLIDLGGDGQGGRYGRIWILDPIDGTLAYMRNQQYAVCLCLVVDGEQAVGVLACPNMNLDSGMISENSIVKEGNGYLLSAVKDQGSFIRPLTWGKLNQPSPVKLGRPMPAFKDLRFVESLATTSMNHGKQKRVAEKLGAQWPGTDLWSIQMKYVALTVGGHDVVVRIPKKDSHRTSVWDHAGGHLIYEEAGGKVTDMNGKKIDFGAGRRCYNNIGNLLAPPAVYGDILKVVQEVIEEPNSGS